MLDYKILDYKAKISTHNDEYLDLLSNTFKIPANITGTPLVVNKYYIARPDLISFAIYGDDKYADIICKINGISNPFELNEGDMLFIPNPEFLGDIVKATDVPSDFIKENDNILSNDTNFQKKKNEKRSPNQQVEGDKNFIIDKSLGFVFY